MGLGITLTNNEIKDIMKVIKSLGNRGILLKGTTRKITSQERGFLSFLRPLMTTVLPLTTSVLTPSAKVFLLPLGLLAEMSAEDAAIQKKIYGSGSRVSIVSNEEMEDILRIVKSLEQSRLLIKGISETIKNEAKEPASGFLSMLLETLGASMLGSELTGGVVVRADEATIGAGGNF